jgi:glycosyltransferase involved in cell wall biosynthesis
MFHSTLPQPGRKLGGVEVFVHRLTEKLIERGHDLTVFSLSCAPPNANYEANWPLKPIPDRSAARRLIELPVRLNGIPTSELDILHLHGSDWFYIRRSAPTMRSFYGSALLEARHATRLRRTATQLAVFPLELCSARIATRAYSVGPGWRRLYKLSGELNCGVEVPDHAPDVRTGPPSILFVGTWEGRKRGRFLYDLFLHTIRPRIPDAELWMVSDSCVETQGIRWIKSPSDAELVDLYRRAWVFCLPSTYEGFGIPYIEAMSQGTPVVATANPGACYVLDSGRAGLLASDDTLRDVLVRVLSDCALRDSLSCAGRARALDFVWDRVLDDHESAYEATILAWGDRKVCRSS